MKVEKYWNGVVLENFDFNSILQLAQDWANVATKSGKLVEELYRKSRRDLESSRLLYEAGHFDNSIQLLQQSVEKAAKGIYALHTGASLKDLKDISHRSPDAFMELFKSLMAKYSQYVKVLVPTWDGSTLVSQIENLVSKEEDFVRMTEAHIDKFLSIPRQLISGGTEENKLIRSAFGRPDIAGILAQTGVELNEDAISRMTEPIYALYSIFVMSLITFPHSQSTRYRISSVCPDDYKKGLGIVDAAPKLLDEMSKCTSILEFQLNNLSTAP